MSHSASPHARGISGPVGVTGAGGSTAVGATPSVGDAGDSGGAVTQGSAKTCAAVGRWLGSRARSLVRSDLSPVSQKTGGAKRRFAHGDMVKYCWAGGGRIL